MAGKLPNIQFHTTKCKPFNFFFQNTFFWSFEEILLHHHFFFSQRYLRHLLVWQWTGNWGPNLSHILLTIFFSHHFWIHFSVKVTCQALCQKVSLFVAFKCCNSIWFEIGDKLIILIVRAEFFVKLKIHMATKFPIMINLAQSKLCKFQFQPIWKSTVLQNDQKWVFKFVQIQAKCLNMNHCSMILSIKKLWVRVQH